MEEVVLDKIYRLLKTQGYKFRKYPGKSAAKFSSYKDAFDAALCIENSFIKASGGQHKTWLYFGEKVEIEEEPEDPEIGEWIEVEELNEDDEGRVTFGSVMIAFCMHLQFFETETKTKNIVKKNKAVIKGDPHERFSTDLYKVIVIKKKNKVVFKRRERI